MMVVYLLQWDVVWNDKQANFRKVRDLLSTVSVKKGALIALPEMFATGFMHAPKEGAAEDFSLTDSSTVAFLSDLAKETESVVLGGGIAVDGSCLKNRVGVFSPKQENPILVYDKMQPFFSEKKYFSAGSEVVSFDWNGLKISPFICFDLRFPEHFRKAVSLGSEAFYVGASWPSVRDSHWKILLKARAVENQAYVFGVNRIGKDPYASYAGGSCIISPKGEVLASAFDKEMVICAEVNPEEVREWRKEFPVLAEAFPFF